MAYGNEAGIVIVDIEQKVCLLNIGSPDLYGAQDPYSRVPRSPKKNNCDSLPVNIDREERQPRSPSIDQVRMKVRKRYERNKIDIYFSMIPNVINCSNFRIILEGISLVLCITFSKG